MPLPVDDVSTLQQYLAGVVHRADHHADNVRYVVLPLIGTIILFKSHDYEIKVLAHDGETKTFFGSTSELQNLRSHTIIIPKAS